MKSLRFLILGLIALVFFCDLRPAVRPLRLTICDSSPRSLTFFQSFADIARAARYTVDYISIHNLLDETLFPKIQAKTDLIFFVITPELLQGIAAKHFAAEQFVSFIKEVVQDNRIFTAFCFPSVPFRSPQLSELLSLWGVGKEVRENARVTALLSTVVEQRPRAFHTTLLSPRGSGLFKVPKEYLPTAGGAYLPLQLPTTVTESLWPVGCLVPKNEHFIGSFVTQSSWLTFNGISENFHLMPIESSALAALHKQIYWTLKDLGFYLREGRLPLKGEERSSAQPLPPIATASFLEKMRTNPKTVTQKTKTMRPGMPLRTAWLDLEAFEDGSPAMMEKLKELVAYLFEGDVGALWLGISPQWYLGATAGRKERAKSFMMSVGRFTKALEEGAKKYNKPVPELFVGFEIANNLNGAHMPAEPAVTLYGDVCDDIWAGTNKTFWKTEVIDPFLAFVTLWQDPRVSHGLKLTGIVLDCEMYGRKKAAEYHSLLCYEPASLAEFLGVKPEGQTQEGLVKQIASKHLFKKYESFVEKKARDVGTFIREQVEKVCPQAIMGCYMAHADLSPFYVGLLQGLGQRKPVDFYTFNVSLEPYKPFLEYKHVFVHHATVAMLSKFRKPEDALWFKILKKFNHGIWLNKASRLPFYKKGEWFEPEQTSLGVEEKNNLMRHWATVK